MVRSKVAFKHQEFEVTMEKFVQFLCTGLLTGISFLWKHKQKLKIGLLLSKLKLQSKTFSIYTMFVTQYEEFLKQSNFSSYLSLQIRTYSVMFLYPYSSKSKMLITQLSYMFYVSQILLHFQTTIYPLSIINSVVKIVKFIYIFSWHFIENTNVGKQLHPHPTLNYQRSQI